MSKIQYQNSSSKLGVYAVVAAVVLGGGAYWLWSTPSEVEPGVTLSNDSALPGWPQATTGNALPTEATAPAVLSDGRPSDVSADDWAALKAALAKVGATPEEAERIVGFNRYQRNFEGWQQIDEEEEASRRRRVAQSLLNELPKHVSKGDFTLVEAVMLGAALIAEVEMDESKRDGRLQAWQDEVLTMMPVPTEDEMQSGVATRETELKRRQALAFAEWQAKTDPLERTPARLEQAFEEVRRAYNSRSF